MNEQFKIYILRLREGRIEKIDEKFDPSFMDVAEAELSFDKPVTVRGEASLASDTLILRLEIETEARMPCSICNKDIPVKVEILDFCHTEELERVKSGVFDYSEILREAILLEIPMTTECEGDCPQRETLSTFFATQKKEGEEIFHPFENL